jgi:hypothetical protein
MTIDKKAREPQVGSLPIKFVFSSGDALTQGVVTLGLIERSADPRLLLWARTLQTNPGRAQHLRDIDAGSNTPRP